MTYTVIRSKTPTDGEFDFGVFKAGDRSPTLEVFGRVAEGEDGKRSAAVLAHKIAEFLNKEEENDSL
jgi:hypothetical protein